MLRLCSYLLLAIAAALVSSLVAELPVSPAPRFGRRGTERSHAMHRSSSFAVFDPILRFGATLLSRIPLARWRDRQEQELKRAGYWLGLTPDEYTVLALLSGGGLGSVLGSLAYFFRFEASLVIPGTALGLVVPKLMITDVIRTRAKVISRALPQAIESVALCMGAGLDFPGSLRMLLNAENGRAPLAQEFEAILEELDVGHTRREALLNFADRVHSAAVRDFVRAIVQAEQKGNPLANALRIQGRMINLRRSVAAEEAAARAAVLMIAPMVLLLACILLLLMGPFLVRGVGV